MTTNSLPWVCWLFTKHCPAVAVRLKGAQRCSFAFYLYTQQISSSPTTSLSVFSKWPVNGREQQKETQTEPLGSKRYPQILTNDYVVERAEYWMISALAARRDSNSRCLIFRQGARTLLCLFADDFIHDSTHGTPVFHNREERFVELNFTAIKYSNILNIIYWKQHFVTFWPGGKKMIAWNLKFKFFDFFNGVATMFTKLFHTMMSRGLFAFG